MRALFEITAVEQDASAGASTPSAQKSEPLHGVTELGDHPPDLVVGHVLGGRDGVGQADGVPGGPRAHPHAPVHPDGDLELEALAEGGQQGAVGRQELAHEVQRDREDEPAAGELPQTSLVRVRERLFLLHTVSAMVWRLFEWEVLHIDKLL